MDGSHLAAAARFRRRWTGSGRSPGLRRLCRRAAPVRRASVRPASFASSRRCSRTSPSARRRRHAPLAGGPDRRRVLAPLQPAVISLLRQLAAETAADTRRWLAALIADAFWRLFNRPAVISLLRQLPAGTAAVRDESANWRRVPHLSSGNVRLQQGRFRVDPVRDTQARPSSTVLTVRPWFASRRGRSTPATVTAG